MSLTPETIQKIIDLDRGIHKDEIDGRIYTNKKLIRLEHPEESKPDRMEFSTLQGIIDFARGFDPPVSTDKDTMFFHVESPTLVSLCGQLQSENDNKRFIYATASMGLDTFKFASPGQQQWYDLELFVISLQSMFVQNETVESILSMLGNVADETVTEHKDDNFSQSLSVRMGLHMRENVKVKNPVELKPYRTFREVEQPAGSFILRLKKLVREDNYVSASMWEADGGAWRLEAMSNIKWMLMANSDLQVIA